MSSPVEGDGKRHDPSAYAPKRVRDSIAKGVMKTPALPKTSTPSRVSSPFQRRLRPAIRPAHIGLSIRPSREKHGLLAGLGARALRANSLKVTRTPACLVFCILSS